MAFSTFTCSSRTASASNETGGSMAISAAAGTMWFCTMSRSAPALLVVAAAPLDAQRLGDGDLHVVDVAAVPDRLEDAVGEAEHHDVLHRLLAEVVVDAVDLLLAEDLAGCSRLSACADSRSWPNGFSMITRRQLPVSSSHQARLAEAGGRSAAKKLGGTAR